MEYKNGGKTNISVDEKEKLKVWPELPKYTLLVFVPVPDAVDKPIFIQNKERQYALL